MDEKLRPLPPLEVTRIPSGVWVDTYWQPIPQRSLIRVILNTALITKFNLDGASFGVEGGVSGSVGNAYFELDNFGSERGDGIGLTDSNYVWGLYTTEPRHFKRVFDYYEGLLRAMFEGEKGTEVLAGKYATPEQTLGRLSDVLAEVGGKGMHEKVRQRILSLSERERVYLRGLTDDEIRRTYVPSPVTIIKPGTLPKPN
ncbi:MAG: hypothetical protein AAB532_02325 [Patescibacteria group bacterium]